MTAPKFAPCRCAHPKSDHAQLAPQCSHAGCSCLHYRPDIAAAKPSTSPIPSSRPPAPVHPLPVREPIAPAPDPPTEPAPAAPAPAPEVRPFVAAVDQPDEQLTTDQLLERGRTSELKPIVNLAARIDTLVEDLRERIAGETAAAGIKAQIAELEQQLAAKKGQLREVATGKKATAESAEHECPTCHERFGTAQGVGAHRSRKHGYRKAG